MRRTDLRIVRDPLRQIVNLTGDWRRSDEPQPTVDPFDDASVPWWALRLVQARTQDEERARVLRLAGHDVHLTREGRWQQAWLDLCARVGEEVSPLDPAWWVEHEPDLARHLARLDPRSFCQLAGVQDDQGQPVTLADFQVRGLTDLRRRQPKALILWPYEHGKSYVASVLLPLLDWAEDAEATQIRIYYSEGFAHRYARKLMWVIQGGWPRLNRLFPHIRPPMTWRQKESLPAPIPGDDGRDDPCLGYWSTEALSIGGKRVPDASFRPLTAAAGQTGWRAWRVVADDLVNVRNSTSLKIQETLWDYLTTAMMTMPVDPPPPPTPYRTRWGTLGVVGTLFSSQDMGNRLYHTWLHDPTARVRRLDILPRGDRPGPDGHPVVLWPARKPWPRVQQMRADLGRVAFDQRCRNIPHSVHGVLHFARGDVERALVDLPFGILPPQPLRRPLLDGPQRPPNSWIVGFDPAKGKRTTFAKNPAALLLCHASETNAFHVVRWSRWRGLNQQRQAEELVRWAQDYHCPIAFERNYDEDVYRDHVGRIDPHVRLVSYTTTANKRDPADGIPSLIPLFENGAVRIHRAGAPKEDVDALVAEITHYPDGQYTDLVIALWVALRHLREHMRRAVTIAPSPVPGYVAARRLGGVIDLRPFRGG